MTTSAGEAHKLRFDPARSSECSTATMPKGASRSARCCAASSSTLCDLYALHNIEEDKGFYQEHGRLSRGRCKAVTREVNRLCNEVRAEAGAFVDAFGIPDRVLGAPIAVGQSALVDARA
jgi:hypothetical protein